MTLYMHFEYSAWWWSTRSSISSGNAGWQFNTECLGDSLWNLKAFNEWTLRPGLKEEIYLSKPKYSDLLPQHHPTSALSDENPKMFESMSIEQCAQDLRADESSERKRMERSGWREKNNGIRAGLTLLTDIFNLFNRLFGIHVEDMGRELLNKAMFWEMHFQCRSAPLNLKSWFEPRFSFAEMTMGAEEPRCICQSFFFFCSLSIKIIVYSHTFSKDFCRVSTDKVLFFKFLS